MFGRPLVALGLALVVSSCSKAESGRTEPAPAPAVRAEDPAPVVDPTPPEGAPAPVKIEPVQVQAKGVGAPAKAPDKPGAKPEPPAPAPDADTSFKLVVEQPAPVAAGGEAVLRVKVTPGTGYKMNAEFPTKLTLDPVAGVDIDKTSMVLADAEKFDDHQLVFAVKATPQSAGSYTVSGKIKFAVCTDATCDPKKRDVSFTIAAK